ncbi:MAG: hypothetical protein GF317_21120 [Candidatus Lokiarchaeota archaeon]|nr:hypothetical protein [Candidatus Lokiarchaeota archaeon]MBD3201947.1 hypothetical protein [Candidatus Lokiarchaeota archaeon]
MKIRKLINNARAKVSERVLQESVIKKLMYLLVGLYLLLLIIGHIIASLATDYTIWDNWISDLGGSKYTPAPYLYDLACIIAGILTIPFTFYMEHFLSPDINKTTRMRIRIVESAFIFGFLGAISYIGVGIFSEDRNYYGLHGLFSELAFGGFTVNAMFTGWFIMLYKTKIPKILGIYGAFGPLTFLILFVIIGNPLFEWLLLFGILLWIIPLSISVFHKRS